MEPRAADTELNRFSEAKSAARCQEPRTVAVVDAHVPAVAAESFGTDVTSSAGRRHEAQDAVALGGLWLMVLTAGLIEIGGRCPQ